jgi:outer membrane protein TolC
VEPGTVPANPVRDPTTGLDIWQALQVAGGHSLLIKMARQQVEMSSYKRDEAYALWLPSLRMGLGYTRHDGQLQSTHGDVAASNRNSFFFGGGAGLGSMPLPGGVGGPARMIVNLSLAEVQFEPLIAVHQEAAAEANSDAVMNDVLLEVALAYIDVLKARSQLVNARLAEQDFAALLELTIQFANNGTGAAGDVDRARVALAHQQIQVEDARRLELVHTTTLARHLHVPATRRIEPRETEVSPMEIIPGGQDVKTLVSQALSRRAELGRSEALTMAEEQRLLEEQWRPWLPNIQLGASAGTFGGGPSGSFDGPAGRGDLEALAVWEWRNLGLVDYARQAQQRVRIRQRQIATALIKDQVVAEVRAATTNVDSYQRQMQTALASLQAADSSYRRTLQRVRQAEGMPIELLESIRARLQTRNDHTRAISGFNRAQFQLLRAIGSPAVKP